MDRNKFSPRYLIELSQKMRKHMTAEEELLWFRIRRRQIEGLRFRRQHPIGRYITDFCCPELRLIIELDGEIHQNQIDYDRNRGADLSALGYRTIRFTNEDIIHRLNEVIAKIRRIAGEIRNS